MADSYSFLVIKYPKADTGMAALAALKELQAEKVVTLRDAAAITKTEKGKIKVHQTKDDSIGKGFLKGGLLGVVFGVLFGPVGWVALGAAAGGLFASFDRGIKNKLLKELGENMTPSESAVAILVEHADWEAAFERMKAHGFGGELVVSEIVEEDLAEVERLLEDPKTVEAIPEELVVVATVEPVVEEPVPDIMRSTRHMRVDEVEGIGPVYAEKLAAVGVKTTDDLLEFGAKPGGRDKLAGETAISEKLILDWVNHVDLMRVPGVGPQYSDLLEAAGVDSPAELARRNPANLAVTIQEVVAARPGIVRRVPTLADVEGWIEEAGKLEKLVEH